MVSVPGVFFYTHCLSSLASLLFCVDFLSVSMWVSSDNFVLPKAALVFIMGELVSTGLNYISALAPTI